LKNFVTEMNHGNPTHQIEVEVCELIFANTRPSNGDCNRIITCTNPSVINVAHLLHETVTNSFFVFLHRERAELAAEIFCSEYALGSEFSYDAAACLRYVDWYDEMASVLHKKMTTRAMRIDYRDFLERPNGVAAGIEKLLRADLGVAGFPTGSIARQSKSEYSHLFNYYISETL